MRLIVDEKFHYCINNIAITNKLSGELLKRELRNCFQNISNLKNKKAVNKLGINFFRMFKYRVEGLFHDPHWVTAGRKALYHYENGTCHGMSLHHVMLLNVGSRHGVTLQGKPLLNRPPFMYNCRKQSKICPKGLTYLFQNPISLFFSYHF